MRKREEGGTEREKVSEREGERWEEKEGGEKGWKRKKWEKTGRDKGRRREERERRERREDKGERREEIGERRERTEMKLKLGYLDSSSQLCQSPSMPSVNPLNFLD